MGGPWSGSSVMELVRARLWETVMKNESPRKARRSLAEKDGALHTSYLCLMMGEVGQITHHIEYSHPSVSVGDQSPNSADTEVHGAPLYLHIS